MSAYFPFDSDVFSNSPPTPLPLSPLTVTINQKNKMIRNLQTELQTERSQVSVLQLDLSNKDELLNKKDAALMKLKKELQEMHRMKTELDELIDVKEVLAIKQQELEKLKAEEKSFLGRQDFLQKTVQEAEEENRNLNFEIDNLEKQLHGYQALQIEKNELLQSCSENSNRLHAMQQEIHEYKEYISDLKETIEMNSGKLECIHEGYQKQIAALEEALNDKGISSMEISGEILSQVCYEHHIQDLQTTIDELKAEFGSERNKLEEQIADYETKCRSLDADIEHLKITLQNTQDNFTTQLAEEKLQNLELTKKVQLLAAELDENRSHYKDSKKNLEIIVNKLTQDLDATVLANDKIVSDLSKQVQHLQTENGVLQRNNVKLEQTVADMMLASKEQEESLVKCEQKIKEQNEQLAALSAEKEQLDKVLLQRTAQLEGDVELLNSQLSETRKCLEESVDATNQLNEKFSDTIADKDIEIQSLSKCSEELSIERNILKVNIKNLKYDIAKFSSDILELKNVRVKCEQQIQDQANQLAILNAEKQSLSEDLLQRQSRFEKEFEELNSRLEEAQTCVESSAIAKEGVDELVNSLSIQLAENGREREELQNQIDGLLQQVHELEKDREDHAKMAKLQLEENNSSIELLKQEKESMSEMLNTLRENLGKLSIGNSGLETVNNSLLVQLMEEEMQCKTLHEQVLSLQLVNDELRLQEEKNHERLQNELADKLNKKNETIETLTNENFKLLQDLDEQLELANQRMHDLEMNRKKEHKSMRDQVYELEKCVEEKNVEYHNLEKQMMEQINEVASLSQQLNLFRNQEKTISELKLNNKYMMKKNESFGNEITFLKKNQSSLKKVITDLEDKLAQGSKSCGSLEEEIKYLTESSKQLESDNLEIKKSSAELMQDNLALFKEKEEMMERHNNELVQMNKKMKESEEKNKKYLLTKLEECQRFYETSQKERITKLRNEKAELENEMKLLQEQANRLIKKNFESSTMLNRMMKVKQDISHVVNNPPKQEQFQLHDTSIRSLTNSELSSFSPELHSTGLSRNINHHMDDSFLGVFRRGQSSSFVSEESIPTMLEEFEPKSSLPNNFGFECWDELAENPNEKSVIDTTWKKASEGISSFMEPDPQNWRRLSEMQRRNTLCLPHLRTAYPVETQMCDEHVFPEAELRKPNTSAHTEQLSETKISMQRKNSFYRQEDRENDNTKDGQTTLTEKSMSKAIKTPSTFTRLLKSRSSTKYNVNKMDGVQGSTAFCIGFTPKKLKRIGKPANAQNVPSKSPKSSVGHKLRMFRKPLGERNDGEKC